MNICKEVYLITSKFPNSEIYGLTSQIRRCSVSIPSNIAEGHHRGSRTEYKQFLRIAYGSGAELETQLEIAQSIGYLQKNEFENLQTQLDSLMKMLNKLIASLSPKPNP